MQHSTLFTFFVSLTFTYFQEHLIVNNVQFVSFFRSKRRTLGQYLKTDHWRFLPCCNSLYM